VPSHRPDSLTKHSLPPFTYSLVPLTPAFCPTLIVHACTLQAAAELLLSGRPAPTVRDKWVKRADPLLLHSAKGGWGAGEDAALAEAVAQLGPAWSEVARRLPGRTDAQVMRL
jgi:Myb-like DNA-binding domain